MTGVELRTGARLHFGLLAHGDREGRLGGIGVMIDRPGFRLTVMRADADEITATAPTAARVRELLAALRRTDGAGLDHARDGFRIAVDAEIPAHRGFGSGTQLAYAVAFGVSRVLGLDQPADVTRLGRGSRSAVGSLGFVTGGFVADLPGRPSQAVPLGDESARKPRGLPAFRCLPDDWRFVVVDPTAGSGPSGPAESDAFRRLPPMPAATTARLETLAADAILPAADRGDFSAFSAGAAEFNRLVGEHFAPAQGGVYADPLIRNLADRLAESDWPHLAQSSWGPAAAVFCDSPASAAACRTWLEDRIGPGEASVFVAAPRDRGADVLDM